MKKIIIGILTLALLHSCTSNVKKNVEEVKKYPPFEVQNMDNSIKPGNDFFTYVNGTWLKNNPIPADKNSRSTFDELFERNRHDIREIIEEAAATKDAQPGSITEKIGMFYNSGIDSLSLEKQGITPLKPFFEKIESIKTITDVQSVGAYLQTSGVNPFFAIFSNQDAKNSTSVIAGFYQACIGLPERDYYFNNDEPTKKIREDQIHESRQHKLVREVRLYFEYTRRSGQTKLCSRLCSACTNNQARHIRGQSPSWKQTACRVSACQTTWSQRHDRAAGSQPYG